MGAENLGWGPLPGGQAAGMAAAEAKAEQGDRAKRLAGKGG